MCSSDLFEKGVAKVRYVAGEFYWRVKVGDAANVSDYVCPPKMLSLEETSGERVWSLGDHLEPSEVADAFGIPFYKLPVRTGTGAVQPNPHFIVESGIASVWLFSSLAVFLIFLAFMPFYQSRLIYSEVLTPVPGVEGAVTTPAFEITSKHSNAELSLLADVNNNWLEIEGELAGESSNYSEDFDLGVEYYSGYDSDGAWSEGSKSGSHFFSSLPRGTYHLRLKSSGAAVRHQVKLREGVWMWSNLFLSWALLASIPIWVLLRKKRFELARWSNSDFLPTGNLRPEDDE